MGRGTVGLCANMDIPAHSSSVPVSAVGAAAAQQSLILPTVRRQYYAHRLNEPSSW